MDRDTYENIEITLWLLGIISLGIGCGFQWGWPASMIAVGGLFALWPLAKRFREP